MLWTGDSPHQSLFWISSLSGASHQLGRQHSAGREHMEAEARPGKNSGGTHLLCSAVPRQADKSWQKRSSPRSTLPVPSSAHFLVAGSRQKGWRDTMAKPVPEQNGTDWPGVGESWELVACFITLWHSRCIRTCPGAL